MSLVAITRLRVRSWRFLPIFFLQALRSARQAAKSEGNLATRLLRGRRNTFWTCTVWTTDEAMKDFMFSSVHRRVMRKLPLWWMKRLSSIGSRTRQIADVVGSPHAPAARWTAIEG